jgi:hypothetical protein
MADSKTAIINMALRHLGQSEEITSPDEDSNAARSASRFWDMALRIALRGYDWPFAMKAEPLRLVTADPTPEWAWGYEYPLNCLKARRILSGLRTDNAQSVVPYKVQAGTRGLMILTDQENAWLEFSFLQLDPSIYPAEFTMGLSYLLAFYMASAMGASLDLGKMSYDLAQMNFAAAAERCLGERVADPAPDAEHIRARN